MEPKRPDQRYSAERLTERFGERLAQYRKLVGISTQKLSDRMDGDPSRAVIANIESGRKRDVSIDDVLAFSVALHVPPVALLLPLDRPFDTIHLHANVGMKVFLAASWFVSNPTMAPNDVTYRPRGNAGSAYANQLLGLNLDYGKWSVQRYDGADGPPEEAAEMSNELALRMASLGIDSSNQLLPPRPFPSHG